MEISYWNAAVPCDGEWIVRNPYYLAQSAHCADIYYVPSGAVTVIAVHAFIKKTQKTPEADLKLAQKRQQEIEHEKE